MIEAGRKSFDLWLIHRRDTPAHRFETWNRAKRQERWEVAKTDLDNADSDESPQDNGEHCCFMQRSPDALNGSDMWTR